MKKATSLFIMLMIVIMGWTGLADARPVFSIHLLDVSGSQGDKDKGSPYQTSISVLKKRVDTSSKRDRIIVLGFGKGSGHLLKAVMPSREGPMQIKLKRARRAVIARLAENIKTKIDKIDRTSTDILGALLRAERLFKEENGRYVKRLYIYSDLLDTETLGLGSLKSLINDKVIGRARRNIPGRLPDLAGVEVYCVNSVYYDIAGMNSIQRETAVRRLISLWEKILRNTHAHSVKFTTSY